MAGTPYNGLPGNVVPPSAVNITSSTNASPIVVQTSSNHGCMTGDVVDIQGHQVNVSANGQWTVTVINATLLSLNGSAGVGAGGATGTLQPLSLTGNVSLNPANGDPYDASAYIPGMSCLADRTAWLALSTGAFRLVKCVGLILNQSTANVSYAQNTNVFNTWTVATPSGGGTPAFAVSGMATGDLVLVTYATTCFCPAVGTPLNSWVSIMSAQQVPGGALGAYSYIPGSSQGVSPTGVATPITLRAAFTPGGPTVDGASFSFSPGFFCNGASSPGGTFELMGDAYLEVSILRTTGKGQ